MPLYVMKRYTRKYIKANPDKLFVFGDNCMRKGLGGQAGEARDEPNSVGIRTKKSIAHGNIKDYMTDAEYPLNVRFIFNDFIPVIEKLHQGGTVVWPMDGIGTGLADMPKYAPNTLDFIHSIVESLAKSYGVEYETANTNEVKNEPTNSD